MPTPQGDLKIVETLLTLSDLQGIGDIALLDLAQNSRIETYASGTVLLADEHTDRRLYLLSGAVTLKTADKELQSIEAGSERALFSLFRVRTHGLTAICHGTVELLSVEQAAYERHIALIKPNDAGISVSEYLQDDDEPSVVTEARLDFTHAEVDLPSMPDIATRIFQILSQEDIDIRRVAETVQLDPMIAVRIVQVANSAMYRTTRAVESVKDAIARIGLNATRAVVMSVVLKNLFQPNSSLVQSQFKRFYHHSIRVAAIAHTLARHLQGFDPDEALLAGLIHDIGVVPILIEADHSRNFADDEAGLQAVLQKQSSRIGATLLRQWGFDESFVTVALESESWQRQVDQADYCDLIQVAQLHCAMIGGRKIAAPPINELPAFLRLGMETIEPAEIIKEAKHEIHEIIDLLISP